MVVQKAINNLKQGPKDDKVAVASGIAISVVVVLLAAWAIFFFRGVQKNANQLNLSGGAQDEFNFSSVKEAQEKLKQEYSNTAEEFMQLRNDAAAGQVQGQQQTDVQRRGRRTHGRGGAETCGEARSENNHSDSIRRQIAQTIFERSGRGEHEARGQAHHQAARPCRQRE